MSAREVLLTRTGGWPGKGWPKDELVRYVPAEPLEAENAQLRAENARLKDCVIAYCGAYAAEYARAGGLPPGHLYAIHYDDLEAAGARMNDFTRVPLDVPFNKDTQMTDLTKNLIPHGLLREHYPEVAKALEECGGPWEYYCFGHWRKTLPPSWENMLAYRLAVTKPSIDWSHVSDRFIALATGSAGFTHLFSERPSRDAHGWFGGDVAPVELFASFRPGTCDWRDSLVMRPGYEEQAND